MSVSDRIANFLEKFKKIQNTFLDYLDSEESIDDNFQILQQLFIDSKNQDYQHDLRLFLHLLLKVADNRHRCPNFFSKIERILQLFKEDLSKYKNDDIFQLFESNKRILLYLIEGKILRVDESFVKRITKEKYISMKYPQYFSPEIEPFLKEEWFPKYDPKDYHLKANGWVEEIKQKLPDNFYELRKIGENESYLSQLIRKDAVEDFIAHVSQCCIRPDAMIPPSVYETNSFLIKKQEGTNDEKSISMIEYAAFFGSIQIFTFLKGEGAELTPSLWLEAIHGKNAELIHLLERNHDKKSVIEEEELYKGCVKESIKCHHNEIADYFFGNYLQSEAENSKWSIIQSLEYYNFAFLEKENINEALFCYLCLFDHYSLVKVLLTSRKVNVNSKIIQNHIIQ